MDFFTGACERKAERPIRKAGVDSYRARRRVTRVLGQAATVLCFLMLCAMNTALASSVVAEVSGWMLPTAPTGDSFGYSRQNRPPVIQQTKSVYSDADSDIASTIGNRIGTTPWWIMGMILVALGGILLGRFMEKRTARTQVGEQLEYMRELEQENSEHVRSRQQLHQLAYYDEITSLPNRLFFTEKLHASLMGESNIVCVAMVDLDRFKSFNDTLGHEAGNALLRLVARRIANALPNENVLLARYGGDEFALLITGRPPGECISTIEHVVHSLNEPITELGSELYVTASIGVSHYPSEAGNISELLQQADIAMYRAKEGGGGAHCLYDADVGNSVVSRMEMETNLRRALVNGEMWLEYQPQVELETGEVHAVEALLRWRHPGAWSDRYLGVYSGRGKFGPDYPRGGVGYGRSLCPGRAVARAGREAV